MIERFLPFFAAERRILAQHPGKDLLQLGAGEGPELAAGQGTVSIEDDRIRQSARSIAEPA